MNDYITQPERPFARTNRQTIQQRANLLRELGYERPSIAEICCGDCRRQRQIYQQILQVEVYCGLDLSPTIVALNRTAGVACAQGNALDAAVMSQFTDFDVVFFGPPLSILTQRAHLTGPSAFIVNKRTDTRENVGGELARMLLPKYGPPSLSN